MNTSTMACYVHDIGTAVPDYSLDPQQSVELFKQTCSDPRTPRLLPRIVRLSGIQRRYLAAMDPRFGPYGAEALYRPPSEQPGGPGMGARNALFSRVSGPLVQRTLCEFPAERLTGVNTVITVSCTHASAPGLEQPIFACQALPPSADRWNLGFMGCSGGLAAMRMVHQMAARGKEALIVACECSSLHFQYTDKLDQLTANVLFADGAAAMLLSPQPSPVRVVDCRCTTLPAGAAQMVWFADDHGLRLELSQDLPDTLGAHLPQHLAQFLADNGTTVAGINHWLVHPGGPQILDSVQASLGLPADALRISRDVLRRYGNMSSPTIFFILKELLGTKPNGRCVALAFGPGLTIEMVLLDIRNGQS